MYINNQPRVLISVKLHRLSIIECLIWKIKQFFDVHPPPPAEDCLTWLSNPFRFHRLFVNIVSSDI